jgi:hypothetical protein
LSSWRSLSSCLRTSLAPLCTTVQLSSSSACISEVIPVLYTICHNIGTITSDDHGVIGLKKGLLESVNTRLGAVETMEVYTVATMCDPRYADFVVISNMMVLVLNIFLPGTKTVSSVTLSTRSLPRKPWYG